MKPHWKKSILGLYLGITVLGTQPKVQAQAEFAAPFISGLAGLGGAMIGNQFKNQWEYAPLAGAALAPMIVDFGYNIFKSKQDQSRIDFYISGRNYERWIQSQKTWYQSTLDPYTGRPPAFSGLSEMDAGMPKDYGVQNSQQDIAQTFSIPVKVPAGEYQGIPRTERIVPFPKLP